MVVTPAVGVLTGTAEVVAGLGVAVPLPPGAVLVPDGAWPLTEAVLFQRVMRLGAPQYWVVLPAQTIWGIEAHVAGD